MVWAGGQLELWMVGNSATHGGWSCAWLGRPSPRSTRACPLPGPFLPPSPKNFPDSPARNPPSPFPQPEGLERQRQHSKILLCGPHTFSPVNHPPSVASHPPASPASPLPPLTTPSAPQSLPPPWGARAAPPPTCPPLYFLIIIPGVHTYLVLGFPPVVLLHFRPVAAHVVEQGAQLAHQVPLRMGLLHGIG